MKKTIGVVVLGITLCGAAGLNLLLDAQENPAAQSADPPSLLAALETATQPSIVSVDVEQPFALSQTKLLESNNSLAKADDVILKHIMQKAIDEDLYQKPLGEVAQTIAEQFLGTPYQENLLNQSSEEMLFTSLQQFDCVLFVETVLAMARGVVAQDYSAKTFVNHLQEQRYVNGEMKDYCSRLHYFSHWIEDNQRRELVSDLTTSLEGIPLDKKLNFMSSNWQKYPKLVNNENTRQCIGQMEAKLNWTNVRYIPTAQVASSYPELQPGDVIAIATDIPGLDVTHTGLAYRTPEGAIGLIHAAPSGVKISPDLETYVGNLDNAIGILVARPVDRRSPSKSSS